MSHDGDCAQDFRAMMERRKEMRRRFGVPCPSCAIERPKAYPSILLPGQRCLVDGYVDPRPETEGEA